MPIVSNDFSDIVYNRRSIRKFDTSVKIPREEMLEILDKTVTAPSSVNMQPWRFVVVDSEEGKDKLKPLSATMVYKMKHPQPWFSFLPI